MNEDLLSGEFMKELFEFLSDNNSFQEWCEKEGTYDVMEDYLVKATLFAMEVELLEAHRRFIWHQVIVCKSLKDIARTYDVTEHTVSRVISGGRTKLMYALRYTAPWILNEKIEKRGKDRRRRNA